MNNQSACFKILFLLLFCTLYGSSGFAQTTTVDSFLHAGVYRSYRVYLPALYDGSKEVPLVFNMHGLGSDAIEQENYGDFRPVADTANFIIVHPTGSDIILSYKGWNTFGAIGTGADDLGFIARLLDTIETRYKINKNKVYAAGMSNGGFMSYELACFMSRRITAIASVTGSMTVERRAGCAAAHAIPVMQIHGTADRTVGYDGTNYLSGSPGFTHIDTLMQYWTRFNGCGPAAVISALPDINPSDGCTAEHYIWSGGREGSTVEHYKIIIGKHTWPGSLFITDVTNQDFNASREIWRFFNQFSLDQFSLSLDNTGKITPTVTVFPNPVSDQIYITMGNTYPKIYRIKLCDAMGKLNFTTETRASSVQIPRNNLPSGIYYLHLSNDETSIVRKIVLN